MNIRVAIAFIAFVPLISCQCQKLALQRPSSRNPVSCLYRKFHEQPSKEHLLDLLLGCSEHMPEIEILVVLRNCLRGDASTVANFDDVPYTDHMVAAACLSAIMGSSLATDGLSVQAIMSRRIDDVPYRYHFYVIQPEDAKRLEFMASAWIDGFLAGTGK